jgi:hypothetical protein
MNGEIDKDATMPEQDSEINFIDMYPLINRVRSFVAERQQYISRSTSPVRIDELNQKFGFHLHKKNNPELILARDVAVELGHPATISRAILLMTDRAGHVVNGQISLVGPDLQEMDRTVKYPFAQVLMLSMKRHKPINPFYLENTQYLYNRLPGYMVRSVPGKLWVRVSQKSIQQGMRLSTVGSAIIAAYEQDIKAIEKIEIVFVTQSKEDVESLNPIAIEANILSGRHKKLYLGASGEIECTDLTCETCDEKSVCNSLRDVAVKRRGQRK